MYSGTLIDDLIKTVERTEKPALTATTQPEEMAYWHAVSQNELVQFEAATWLGWHKMAAAAVKFSADRAGESRCWVGTPEIYFPKAIDNSRLVKIEDPQTQPRNAPVRHRAWPVFSCW